MDFEVEDEELQEQAASNKKSEEHEVINDLESRTRVMKLLPRRSPDFFQVLVSESPKSDVYDERDFVWLFVH
ncbi:hypothetical protein Pyn_21293 [Prunus yedoensis var. nudiflora]|uniref:Uncharacterized protein n=1 Tax=Prunus yedoensis var. nudiflora TaxID=2094558 RepID=A0A314UC69_PRUYE|nr:hypothetical protein Pyn_21293 [Prunus yedoensis var. nudiflora]